MVLCLSGCADSKPVCAEATLSLELHRIVPPSRGNVHLDGISSDGSAVVGTMLTSDFNASQLFRWNEASGVLPLGFVLGDHVANSIAVSADGTTVVGFGMWAIPKQELFRWTEAGGIVGLSDGTFQGRQVWISGVSRDGSMVAGGLAEASPGGFRRVFRWTESSGVVVLQPPAGASGATATNVSADGSTIVGHSFIDNASNTRVFRWTESTGAVNLDAPAEAVTTAVFVNDDGSTIVGVAGAQGSEVAFRWTERTGFVGLGPLPGFINSWPTGMSADGSVVVGVCTNGAVADATKQAAFRWTEKAGLRALPLFQRDMPHQGNQAVDVSFDGSTVVGLDYAWTGEDTGGSMMDVVVWHEQGCPARVRPTWDSAEPYRELSAISGDGRTIIGTASTEDSFSTGWVVRLR